MILGRPRICAIESDNVVVLVFDPDPPLEESRRTMRFGLNIDYEAAHVSQEFAAHQLENVMRFSEIDVGHHHVCEPQRIEVQSIEFFKLLDAFLQARGARSCCQLNETPFDPSLVLR